MKDEFAYNNGKIVYEVHGKKLEGKSTIVFIHGHSLNRREWDLQVDELTKEGNKVITYDRRGYGESSELTGKYSDSDDLEGLLKHLGVERAEICGHSSGGGVALEYAINYPNRVEGLILIASSLGSYGVSKEDSILYNKWRELASKGMMDTVKEEILQHPSLNTLKTHKEEYELVKNIVNDYEGGHFLHDNLVENTPHIDEEIYKISCPTKIIIGEDEYEEEKLKEDKFKEEEGYTKLFCKSDKIHKEISNSELQVVEGAGHFVNLEKPDVVNLAINEFIEGKKEGRAEIDNELAHNI